MESQPQNSEFRTNPENFHPWIRISRWHKYHCYKEISRNSKDDKDICKRIKYTHLILTTCHDEVKEITIKTKTHQINTRSNTSSIILSSCAWKLFYLGFRKKIIIRRI